MSKFSKKNYQLASDTWDKLERNAIYKIVKSGQYTMGEKVRKFEKEFCKYLDTKNAVMVNSGSSANLLIMAALALKYRLKGNIIVPAVSWSTTYFPCNQYGFSLNFVDIDKNTLNLDIKKTQKAINSKTVAIMAVNLLGNSNDFRKLKTIAKKNNLILIEDNCESFGAISNTNQFTGTIGSFGSFSFFFSHHLQTMEGGMIVCKSKDDADFIKTLRAHGWVRDIDKKNKIYKHSGNNFNDSFTFITPGYNLRPLEFSGAVGSIQLKKWPSMRKKRISNANYFKKLFSQLNDRVLIQKEIGKSSWFGFSIILIGDLENKREEILKKLDQNKVMYRPIVSGNFMKNPVMKYLKYIDNKNYESANYLNKNGFFIGNDIINLKKNIKLVYEIISNIK
ncbi:MAG: pyridoxamine 5-phosphate oxidase [Pelagibacteraceae bacterium]|nr:pyridoxamine 5-phosphate oxidase [Pelagibacteraceae bacterium]|tara:strand:- start:758 stop:1936 length:1179 start_codon:yes stop_codon:yes gene_type:complete